MKYTLKSLTEAKREKVADRIKISPMQMYEARYKDSTGRWGHAGYHHTPADAEAAARRAHRDANRKYESADYAGLNDKPSPPRNPWGE